MRNKNRLHTTLRFHRKSTNSNSITQKGKKTFSQANSVLVENISGMHCRDSIARSNTVSGYWYAFVVFSL